MRSRRGMLAFGWSLVTLLTVAAFITALVFTVRHQLYIAQYYDGYNYDDEDGDGDNYYSAQASSTVSSKAMAFAALWTAMLAGMLAVSGTVVLGYQSLSGQYYWCCSGNVHNTTPLSLGGFIGALLMFANLTLVCSVLFGEFEVRGAQFNATWDSSKLCL